MTDLIRIFLSYAQPDEQSADKLYQKLFDAGFKPWMDTKDIVGEERRESLIQKAIRHSDVLLLCLSSNSINKRGCLQKTISETLGIWQEEVKRHARLVAVRLEEFEIPECLRDLQWVNLFEEQGWAQLLEAIQEDMKQQMQMESPIRECGRLTTILIADDNEFVAKGMRTVLTESGPATLNVEVEYELIERVAQRINSRAIDVLILDLDWYGDQEAGLQAIRDLKLNAPDLRIVAISNYPNLVSKARAIRADIARPKGFTGEELVRLVELATQLPSTRISTSKDNKESSEETLKALQRRLRVLQVQEAKLGPYTPSYITIDIEETQRAIRNLTQVEIGVNR